MRIKESYWRAVARQFKLGESLRQYDGVEIQSLSIKRMDKLVLSVVLEAEDVASGHGYVNQGYRSGSQAYCLLDNGTTISVPSTWSNQDEGEHSRGCSVIDMIQSCQFDRAELIAILVYDFSLNCEAENELSLTIYKRPKGTLISDLVSADTKSSERALAQELAEIDAE